MFVILCSTKEGIRVWRKIEDGRRKTKLQISGQ